MIAPLFDSLTKVLFPSRCFRCGKGGEVFCSSCLSTSRKVLEVPYPYIISLFNFREKAIRRAIHAIKYYHRKDLIIPFAHSIALECRKMDNELQAHEWVLVPIPMPAFRKLLRGYNQAELIALALGKELSLPVRLDILKRTRSSIRQVSTGSRNERVKNQRGSFSLLKSPAGMHIILIDDVTTTGATLAEARRTLLLGKATNVLAVTLAH